MCIVILESCVEKILQISEPLYISVLVDLLYQSTTSHHREYIYLTCYTSILQYLNFYILLSCDRILGRKPDKSQKS